jgi:hypothetical protein
MTNGRNVRIYKENGGKRIENQSKARVSTRCLWQVPGKGLEDILEISML